LQLLIAMKCAYRNTSLGSVLFSAIPQNAEPDLASEPLHP
jgi:hypothetical protein